MSGGASVAQPASITLAACLLVMLQFASAQSPGQETTGAASRGNAAAGELIYARHCASCHGPRGAGDGQQGRAFDPGPPDFTAGHPDAERFYLATRDGGMAVGVSGAMPAFRHTLSDEEIHDVVTHLMQLAQ